MEKKFNFNIILTLKEICLRKTTVILWSKPNILETLEASNVDEQVKDAVSKLELPLLLTEQMKNLVTPIGLQIRLWRRFLIKYLTIPYDKFEIRFLKQLCWTNSGTLNYQKMAEMLIYHKMFDGVKMYKLACLFCLEDYIPYLWRMHPKVSKKKFYPDAGTVLFRRYEAPLQCCWHYILQGKLAKLNSMVGIYIRSKTFYQYAFEYSAYEGNRAATEYFYLKLTDEERELSLFRAAKAAVRHRWDHFETVEEETFPEEKLSETVFYLLQLMSSKQQLEILKTFPYHVFMCLLDWPWQHHLLDTIGLLSWEYLLEIDNDRRYLRIAKELKNCNFPPKLLQDIFLLSSRNSKKSFIGRECKLGALSNVFQNQDSETIKAIFRNVECVDRRRLVASEHIFKVFYELIARGKSEFVDLCLQEATLSKEDKEGLKETYFVFFKNIEDENTNSRDILCKQLLCLLD